MLVYFDVLHPYYLPQYLPVRDLLTSLNQKVVFVIYKNEEQYVAIASMIDRYQLEVYWVESKVDAIKFYQTNKPDWIIFGNAFSELTTLKTIGIKTALMQHGIGPKSCYYDVSESDFDVRFVEGQYRLQRLQKRFPEKHFIDTGFAKLDPVVNGTLTPLDIKSLGLDPSKKTILYAPTFYPSSLEKMAKKWPLEFNEYNIILKPHYFSLTKPGYKKHKQLLEAWATFDNVYLAPVEEVNLNPFIQVADIMISDASSAIFEFTALNKPVVWCDFYQLRWAYRGIFKFRFKRRMDEDLYKYADIAAHAKSYSQLKNIVDDQVSNPDLFESQRLSYTSELAGVVDGKCSLRIANYLIGVSQ